MFFIMVLSQLNFQFCFFFIVVVEKFFSYFVVAKMDDLVWTWIIVSRLDHWLIWMMIRIVQDTQKAKCFFLYSSFTSLAAYVTHTNYFMTPCLEWDSTRQDTVVKTNSSVFCMHHNLVLIDLLYTLSDILFQQVSL